MHRPGRYRILMILALAALAAGCLCSTCGLTVSPLANVTCCLKSMADPLPSLSMTRHPVGGDVLLNFSSHFTDEGGGGVVVHPMSSNMP